MDKLAKHYNGQIQNLVAWNPNTAPETLKKLAKNSSFAIKIGLATNQNTPAETLKYLAKQPQFDLRWKVAEHSNVTEQLLTQLAEDKDMDVVFAVALNPRTPVQTLQKIAQNHANTEVFYAVIQNPTLNLQLANLRANYVTQTAYDPETLTVALVRLAQTAQQILEKGSSEKQNSIYRFLFEVIQTPVQTHPHTPQIELLKEIVQNVYDHTTKSRLLTAAQTVTLQKLAKENNWSLPSAQPQTKIIQSKKPTSGLKIKP